MRFSISALFVFAATACAQATAGLAELKGVKIIEQVSLTKVTLDLDRATALSHGYLKNPFRFYVDLAKTRAVAVEPVLVAGTASIVERVRVGQPTQEVTRVVVDLKADTHVKVIAESRGKRIVLDFTPTIATLRSVNLALGGDGPEVRLALNREVSFDSGYLHSPERFYVDLKETLPGTGTLEAKSVSHLAVRAVRIGRFTKNTTRVVIELMEAMDASVQRDVNSPDLAIRLSRKSRTAVPDPSRPPVLVMELPRADAVEVLPAVLQMPSLPSPPQRNPVVTSADIPPTPVVIPAAVQPRITIPRVFVPPKIEELLVSPGKLGVAVSGFRQREPRDGIPATESTTAYLSYDERSLYVAFVCEDSAGRVRGRMSKRESIDDDDVVTVYLDTFHDGQRAYYFSVNPLGIQADGMISGTGGTDSRFDTLWFSSGRITDHGFIALIEIPFKSLRFSPGVAQTWGVALSRSIRGRNETSFWPYVTQRTKSVVQQMGIGDGLHRISPTRNVQIIPYGAFTGAHLSDGFSAGYQNQTDMRGGFDAKIVLRDSFTLDFTVKPDFSQVESNDPQVTVNRRFEVFFPEKRPFFLDNQNYFETPLNLLFTRRIAAPDYGVRLTGRVGRWSVGLLGIDDRAPGQLARPGSPLAGRNSGTGVIRVLRDIGRDSNLGALVTERRLGDTMNRVFSFDARLRLSPTWYFTGQAAYSKDRRLGQSELLTNAQGSAFTGTLSRSGRNLAFEANYEDYGKGFRAPLGFVPRVDVRRATVSGSYLLRPQGGRIYAFGPSLTTVANWDHAGRLQDKYSYASYRMDFAGPVGFELYRQDVFERYLGDGFRYHSTGATFYASWIKQFTLSGSYQFGSGLNYTPAAGLAPFVGAAQNVSAGFTWRPNTRLRFDNFYYYTHLGGPRSAIGPVPTAFVNHLERVKVNYQFSKALSFRGILDYNFIAPNVQLFDSSRYKTFTPDLLLTYLLNYGTAFYVGYNQRWENLAQDPDSPGNLHRFGPPSYLTSRQLYVKLSYLVRF